MRQEIQCTPAAAVTFAAQLLFEPAAARARTGDWSDNAKRAFTHHWPEHMIEGLCLGMMISACTLAVLLEHPASTMRMSIANAGVRRFLAGIAMGQFAYWRAGPCAGRSSISLISRARVSVHASESLMLLGAAKGGRAEAR